MNTTNRPLRLLGISGSLRRAANSTALLNGLRALLPEGVDYQVMTLHAVPLYDGDVEAQGIPAGVAALKQAIEAADGVVIASPEYNFSIPGVLKNALDWASRPSGQSSFKGKRVLPLTSSAGPWGGVRAQAPLRDVLASIGAIVSPPPHLAVAQAGQKVHAEQGIVDEALRQTLTGALAVLVESARNR